MSKLTTWYHKTEECVGCQSSGCPTPPQYHNGNNKFDKREYIKCPCVECLVKSICNRYCKEYQEYEYVYYHCQKLKIEREENQ